MVNGCVCCTAQVRADLVEVVPDLVAPLMRPDPTATDTQELAHPNPVVLGTWILVFGVRALKGVFM